MTNYKLDPPQAPALTADSDAAPHPGPMIRDELANAGFSVAGAAAAMAVNRPNLHAVLTGKSALTNDLAYRVSTLLNPDDDAFDFAKLVIGIQAAHDWHKEQAKRRTIKALVAASRQSLAKASKKALADA